MLAYATRHRTGRVNFLFCFVDLVTSLHGTHGSRAVRLVLVLVLQLRAATGGIADRIPVWSFLPAPACGRHRKAGLAFPGLIIGVPGSNGRAQSPRTAFLSPARRCPAAFVECGADAGRSLSVSSQSPPCALWSLRAHRPCRPLASGLLLCSS